MLIGIIFTVSILGHFGGGLSDSFKIKGINITKNERESLKSSGFWPNCPQIHIFNDNWTQNPLDWIQTTAETSNTYHLIENVKIDGGGADYGIKIENCTHPFVIRNSTIHNVKTGIYLVDHTDNGTIQNCTIFDTTEWTGGIYLEDYCDNNRIIGNNASYNGMFGIRLWNNCINNMVSGNTVTNNTIGITLEYCDNNTVSQNTAANNTQEGILALDSDYNKIRGNNVANNTMNGIRLYQFSEFNTISGNNITNNKENGIRLFNDAQNNTISGNIITNNSLKGIGLWWSNENNITKNLIFNNTVYGIYIDSSCVNNLQFYNSIFNNSNNAFDEGTNQWNTTEIGNYWGNYTGSDTDGDGIGETPHNLVGNQDHKPIAIYEPVFFEIPNDLSFEVGSTGQTLTWVVLKGYALDLPFNVSRDGISVQTGELSQFETEIVVDVSELNVGNYNYTFEFEESQGVKQMDEVTVNVTAKPGEYAPPSNGGEPTLPKPTPPGEFELSHNATDPDTDGIFFLSWTEASGADNYSIYYYDEFITEINVSLSAAAHGVVELSYEISGLSNGVYYYKVVAFNEVGSTLSNCVNVTIDIPPEPEPEPEPDDTTGTIGEPISLLFTIMASVISMFSIVSVISLKIKWNKYSKN